MTWTDPITYTKSYSVTAAVLNTYFRDNLDESHWKNGIQSASLTKNANTTFANLAGMSFAVLSGETWLFVAHSFFISSATADAKWTVTAPASSTGRFGVAGNAPGITTASETTFGNPVAIAVPGVLEDNALIVGKVTAGGNGTVQIQAAQNTSTAIDTIFHANSFLLAYRVGGASYKTWTAAETMDATNDMNPHVRDVLRALRFVTNFQTEDLIVNNSATFQNLPGLSFPVLSGEKWGFFGMCFCDSAATPDIAYAVTAPTLSTGRYGCISNSNPLVRGSTTTFGELIAAVITGTEPRTVSVNGLVVAGANGTVQIQGAQNTATASNTTFYQDSFLVAFRLVQAA